MQSNCDGNETRASAARFCWKALASTERGIPTVFPLAPTDDEADAMRTKAATTPIKANDFICSSPEADGPCYRNRAWTLCDAACAVNAAAILKLVSVLRAGRVGAVSGRGGGGRGGSLDDGRSPAGDGVPPGTEGQGALAVRLTRQLVQYEGVERVLVVGQLEAAVAAPRRTEHPRFHSRAGSRLAAAKDGRPELCTAPTTGALAVPVFGEQVEGVALRVHQDQAELRLLERDRRACLG